MAVWFNLVLLLVFAVLLVYTGSWLVKILSKLAEYLKITEFAIGFILMAVATSVPELFVGITSGIAKNTALSLGNVIGSNIANLTVVAGIVILMMRKGINVETDKAEKDSVWMFLLTLVPMVLMLLGKQISRIDGAILVALFGIYMVKVVRRSRAFRKEYKEERELRRRKWVVIYSMLFILCFIILYYSSKYIVYFATELSFDLNLKPIVIGLFLIAIGTSLPELVFSSRAAITGHSEMAISNLIGSVIMNSTLVLGVTALIYPISSDFFLFLSSGIFMLIICLLFAVFVEKGKKLKWKEGVVLVLLYAFFLIMELFIKNGKSIL
ncbi:hypothetical protein DRJ17_03450 [Candidatus Woesearchaeota archaeon]|nr:MAG: hypothetical protein DRJ17_03450 [Candidatus Woesearchaeota archaeon]